MFDGHSSTKWRGGGGRGAGGGGGGSRRRYGEDRTRRKEGHSSTRRYRTQTQRNGVLRRLLPFKGHLTFEIHRIHENFSQSLELTRSK